MPAGRRRVLLQALDRWYQVCMAQSTLEWPRQVLGIHIDRPPVHRRRLPPTGRRHGLAQAGAVSRSLATVADCKPARVTTGLQSTFTHPGSGNSWQPWTSPRLDGQPLDIGGYRRMPVDTEWTSVDIAETHWTCGGHTPHRVDTRRRVGRLWTQLHVACRSRICNADCTTIAMSSRLPLVHAFRNSVPFCPTCQRRPVIRDVTI
jgi:hypothetical protein